MHVKRRGPRRWEMGGKVANRSMGAVGLGFRVQICSVESFQANALLYYSKAQNHASACVAINQPGIFIEQHTKDWQRLKSSHNPWIAKRKAVGCSHHRVHRWQDVLAEHVIIVCRGLHGPGVPHVVDGNGAQQVPAGRRGGGC